MKIYILLISVLVFASCAKKSEDAPANPEVKAEAIGPFTIDFNSDTFQKTISGRITDGRVAFYSYSDQPYQIVVKNSDLQVTGCDGVPVDFSLGWIPNMDQSATAGYTIGKKASRVQVYSKIKSSLVVDFKNVQDCSSMNFNLTLARIPQPQATYGSWYSNFVSPTDPYHNMALNISQLSESVQGVFQITCDSLNMEKLTTEMVYNNESELPKKMIFKVTSVDRLATSACGKQFAAKASDVGKLIYCIHNKSSVGAVFNLACRLASDALTYPSIYTELATSWQKNY
jgi:hypothetical protein